MLVALVLLVLASALLAVDADVVAGKDSHNDGKYLPRSRVIRALSKAEQQGCLYEGRWHVSGAWVHTREACLACACAHGALFCRRRTCVPLPEVPPRCYVMHRRGECCPELRCSDGEKYHREVTTISDDTEVDTPASIGHACVEGGTVYAAGSAMSSDTVCEQCFCLGGVRRCVRPSCLPPPPGCKARPTSGACCPQRYDCEHAVAKPHGNNPQDCVTPEGSWAMEGERVKVAEVGLKCIQCFCLRGSIRCQNLSCAPSLQGCTPLVQPGQCCPHQYQCDRHTNVTKISSLIPERQNTFMSLKDEDRSFHTSKSTKRETTLKEVTTVTDKSTPAVTVTKIDFDTTSKVKRNTDESDIISTTDKNDANNSTTAQTTQKLKETTQRPGVETTTLAETPEELPTEQPNGSVKVIINGTINCTTEISSTSLLLNVSDTNETVWINSQTQPRIPIMNALDIESHTFSPNDIITEGSYKEGDFDENETFSINVTSSLRTNTTRSTTTTKNPLSSLTKTVPPTLLGKVNVSKVKKDEFELDYTEPTLPPSLPNLKIIPFVAADAVVEDDVSSKESLDYSILDREDKFPVYYPNKDAKDTIYETRKEDVYNPTQYPIFISKKVEPQYHTLTQGIDSANVPYASITNDMSVPVKEYTITASLGNSAKINYKGETPPSATNSQFEVEPPAVNLFSPPVETEGGFIPKGPGVNSDFYSVYTSTQAGIIVPHLTTSMQLEPKDECISNDGNHVSEGESVSISCSICTCAWGELHCSPRPCNTPAGCKRNVDTSTTDVCCGELICDQMSNVTSTPEIKIQQVTSNLNETKVTQENQKILQNQQESGTTLRTATLNRTIYKDSNIQKNVPQSQNTFEDSIPVNLVPPGTTEKAFLYTLSAETSNEVFLENNNHSMEYEDDDDGDGFSLGSVLKLLLSDTYETSSTVPPKRTTLITSTTPRSTTFYASTTKRKQLATTEAGFVPVTHHPPYMPPKKLYSPNNINRIDHLVLGESSAIRKSSPQPTFKPVTLPTTSKLVTKTKTTPQPTTTKTIEISSKEGFRGQPLEVRPPIPNFISGFGLGLPKLAGCNIYGRMYRVGRIIAELSSPCQECKCTELGVQCTSLSC